MTELGIGGPEGEPDLSHWGSLVTSRLKLELDFLTSRHPSIIETVSRLADADSSVTSPYRLLPFAVAGALSRDENSAVPVAVLSRMWWLGAEVFDDLNDGKQPPEGPALSRSQATVVSTACLTALPSLIIKKLDVPEDLKRAWEQEYAESTLAAAESQFDDVSRREIRSWSDVMKIYAGKSGAPYGRDTALAAQSAGADESTTHSWRVFGRLFGVLRQLANDRAYADAREDEDLINGTWTLLQALAMEKLGPRQREELRALRLRALDSPSARLYVMECLRSAEVAGPYNRRLGALRSKLSRLNELLTEPSEHRDIIQWMIDESTANAFLTVSTAEELG
ncbi:polyprenyl synthase [Streptomyces sp. NPDC090106]|uniref:polyprenyl synthase n=1 Tax=Streptomyces sp. NPDC090106 TaxID=3365946 RepID=UPI003821C650